MYVLVYLQYAFKLLFNNRYNYVPIVIVSIYNMFFPGVLDTNM